MENNIIYDNDKYIQQLQKEKVSSYLNNFQQSKNKNEKEQNKSKVLEIDLIDNSKINDKKSGNTDRSFKINNDPKVNNNNKNIISDYDKYIQQLQKENVSSYLNNFQQSKNKNEKEQKKSEILKNDLIDNSDRFPQKMITPIQQKESKKKKIIHNNKKLIDFLLILIDDSVNKTKSQITNPDNKDESEYYKKAIQQYKTIFQNYEKMKDSKMNDSLLNFAKKYLNYYEEYQFHEDHDKQKREKEINFSVIDVIKYKLINIYKSLDISYLWMLKKIENNNIGKIKNLEFFHNQRYLIIDNVFHPKELELFSTILWNNLFLLESENEKYVEKLISTNARIPLIQEIFIQKIIESRLENILSFLIINSKFQDFTLLEIKQKDDSTNEIKSKLKQIVSKAKLDGDALIFLPINKINSETTSKETDYNDDLCFEIEFFGNKQNDEYISKKGSLIIFDFFESEISRIKLINKKPDLKFVCILLKRTNKTDIFWDQKTRQNVIQKYESPKRTNLLNLYKKYKNTVKTHNSNKNYQEKWINFLKNYESPNKLEFAQQNNIEMEIFQNFYKDATSKLYSTNTHLIDNIKHEINNDQIERVNQKKQENYNNYGYIVLKDIFNEFELDMFKTAIEECFLRYKENKTRPKTLIEIYITTLLIDRIKTALKGFVNSTVFDENFSFMNNVDQEIEDFTNKLFNYAISDNKFVAFVPFSFKHEKNSKNKVNNESHYTASSPIIFNINKDTNGNLLKQKKTVFCSAGSVVILRPLHDECFSWNDTQTVIDFLSFTISTRYPKRNNDDNDGDRIIYHQKKTTKQKKINSNSNTSNYNKQNIALHLKDVISKKNLNIDQDTEINQKKALMIKTILSKLKEKLLEFPYEELEKIVQYKIQLNIQNNLEKQKKHKKRV